MLRLALASLPRILPEPDRDPLAVLRGGIEQQLFDGNRGEGLRGFHPRLAVSPPAAETDGLRDSPLEGPVRSEPVSEIGLTRVILDDNKQVSAWIKLAETQIWAASEDSWAVINA